MYNKFRPGEVVRSVAGHDAGKLLLVLDTDGGFVIATDGKNRKTGHPKRKNAKHLIRVCESVDKSGYTEDGALCDRKIRRMLAAKSGEVDS